jgi:hypothetical protein
MRPTPQLPRDRLNYGTTFQQSPPQTGQLSIGSHERLQKSRNI